MKTATSIPALAACLLLVSGCVHTPDPRALEAAQIRYDLGVEAMQAGNIQEALRELQSAVERDPNLAKGHNALGLLYHVSLARPDKAERSYKKALSLQPAFSEAANNLGALYLDQGRWAEAEGLFRLALDDVLYPTPHVARGNLGWALYRLGRTEEALVELKSAVVTQPKFCLGYKNLAVVYREQGKPAEAEEASSRFLELCPESAEAHFEWATLRRAAGDGPGAREAFEQCAKLAGIDEMGRRCARELGALGGPLDEGEDPEDGGDFE